jgi:hypothetical protein
MAAVRQAPKHYTLCGIRPRAWVVEATGNLLTYEWPCGYRKTEILMTGHGALRQPAGDAASAMFARYWRKDNSGVGYECPRCRRAARRAQGAIAARKREVRDGIA